MTNAIESFERSIRTRADIFLLSIASSKRSVINRFNVPVECCFLLLLCCELSSLLRIK